MRLAGSVLYSLRMMETFIAIRGGGDRGDYFKSGHVVLAGDIIIGLLYIVINKLITQIKDRFLFEWYYQGGGNPNYNVMFCVNRKCRL